MSDQINGRKKFILCIDDDYDDCNFLAEAISNADNTVETRHASSGMEGLSLMARYIEDKDLPAIITIDINMPGLDGPSTLLELRKLLGNSSIPVVFLSTNTISKDLEKVVREKNIMVMRKPSTISGYSLIADTLVSTMI